MQSVLLMSPRPHVPLVVLVDSSFPNEILSTLPPLSVRSFISIFFEKLTIYGKSHVYEYTIPYSETPTIYDEIERYICVFNPSETTIISNLSTSHLKSVVNYLNISSVHINYINLDDTVIILIHEKH